MASGARRLSGSRRPARPERTDAGARVGETEFKRWNRATRARKLRVMDFLAEEKSMKMRIMGGETKQEKGSSNFLLGSLSKQHENSCKTYKSIQGENPEHETALSKPTFSSKKA